MIRENKILVKVCGMRDAVNILQVAALRPDYMGFIFFRGSRRYVGDKFSIPADFPADIKRVGVFVNESPDEIRRLATLHALNFVQLHGEEPVNVCAGLKSDGMGVIKVFSVDPHFDFHKLEPYKSVVDYFLFDTKGKEAGGNGRTFDWHLLKSYDQEVPFFLGGGISPDNVRGLSPWKAMNIHAVDINSRVEKSPGMKDGALIKGLMDEMKNI